MELAAGDDAAADAGAHLDGEDVWHAGQPGAVLAERHQVDVLVGEHGRGIIGPVIGAVLLTALVNGLTLSSVSEAYQPIAVGTVVVASAVLMRYQR
jgi:hypothetical protein